MKSLYIKQQDNFKGNFGLILRSSLVFGFKKVANFNIIISFINYWRLKGHVKVIYGKNLLINFANGRGITQLFNNVENFLANSHGYFTVYSEYEYLLADPTIENSMSSSRTSTVFN